LDTLPNPDHIFLTDGASVGVRSVLNAMIRDGRDGVMVPIPQYPLYSASIALYGGSLVPYSLNETNGWQMDVKAMPAALAAAAAKGVHARAMVFINPGNPTGQCLPEANLRELVKFAYDHKIVLMADEVYQENIYQDTTPFVSARKVMKDLGEPYASGVELVSFHTVSKGSLGECGLRGGYFEMFNIAQATVDEIYKVASINLSPNVVGQVMMSLMVNPPPHGTAARAQLEEEKAAILTSLRKRSHLMTDGFNALEGVTCNFTEGAMYSFPRLRLPPKAIAAAVAAGKAPDVFYCLQLVEATGISTVPGSGFGQEEGTYHLRTSAWPAARRLIWLSRFLPLAHRAHTQLSSRARRRWWTLSTG
jgi:glutamate--glyoxylate aminotransferase